MSLVSFSDRSADDCRLGLHPTQRLLGHWLTWRLKTPIILLGFYHFITQKAIFVVKLLKKSSNWSVIWVFGSDLQYFDGKNYVKTGGKSFVVYCHAWSHEIQRGFGYNARPLFYSDFKQRLRRRPECLQSEPPRWGGNGQWKKNADWLRLSKWTNHRARYMGTLSVIGLCCRTVVPEMAAFG